MVYLEQNAALDLKMFKISAKQKTRLVRRAKHRQRRKLKRQQKKRANMLRSLFHQISPKQRVESQNPLRYNLHAPATFNLTTNFDDVIQFIGRLRQSINSARSTTINFKTIQEMSPASALILTAEMDRWRRLSGKKLRPIELGKWNPVVRRLLNEMGFFEVLGVANPCTAEDRIQNQNLRFLKFISGDKSDGSLADQLQIAVEAVAGPMEYKQAMYTGITEAMANSVEHAYPSYSNYPPQIKNRWWMSGSYNRSEGRITVMIYDMGVSIPTTLPKSGFFDIVTGFLAKLQLTATDGNLIRGAMEIGKTRTRLGNRGFGLYDMQDFVRRSGKGVLRVISRKGDYSFYDSGKEHIRDNNFALEGTLVAWEIYVKDTSVDLG